MAATGEPHVKNGDSLYNLTRRALASVRHRKAGMRMASEEFAGAFGDLGTLYPFSGRLYHLE